MTEQAQQQAQQQASPQELSLRIEIIERQRNEALNQNVLLQTQYAILNSQALAMQERIQELESAADAAATPAPTPKAAQGKK